MIKIWGPCETGDDVQLLLSGPPSNKAVVFAPSKDIANQICYLVSTHEKRYQSNYQEIDCFSHLPSCILNTDQEPITFSHENVNGLILDPILPPLQQSDIQKESGTLFWARCRNTEEVESKIIATCWVYTKDTPTANAITCEYGESSGLFDLSKDPIQVDLFAMDKASVFWNIEPIMYND